MLARNSLPVKITMYKMSIKPKISGIKQICLHVFTTDHPKWLTGSSTKKCQKLLILAHKTEISDVPTGCTSGFMFY